MKDPEKRTERIEALASQLALPRAALDGQSVVILPDDLPDIPKQAFTDPDPFEEFAFPTRVAAKLAIADYLNLPLAKLPQDQLDEIDSCLSRTLKKDDVIEYVRTQIQHTLRR
jgi:hypothetical protein